MYTKSTPKIYYEVEGSGPPLILLHGNKEDHNIFDKLKASLKDSFTLYLVDARGHGKSEKVNEYHYSDMADDILRIIDENHLCQPYFYGFSDGGIVGLLCAVKRKNAFSKMILSGANANVSGLKALPLFGMKLGYFISRDKRTKMMLKEPSISKEELQSIRCKTLVLAGENDLIKEAHTRYIAKCIKDSKLIIYPKKLHGDYVVHSDFLKDDIKAFLYT
ncbi:MAG: alpha/beta hydrolase [Clostridium sp.]|nr:alpha/beta hydrolase [Clostridium sp.]